MLDWLLTRQRWIETSLANRYLGEASPLILYDVSSSYLEGRCCPLAEFGDNRDGKAGRKQIITVCSVPPMVVPSPLRSWPGMCPTRRPWPRR